MRPSSARPRAGVVARGRNRFQAPFSIRPTEMASQLDFTPRLHCENKVRSAPQLRHDASLAPRIGALDDLISWATLNARFLGVAVSLIAFSTLTAGHLASDMSAQAQQAQPATQGTAAYTIMSRDGHRSLTVRTIGGQEMFALDDLARVFNLTLARMSQPADSR